MNLVRTARFWNQVMVAIVIRSDDFNNIHGSVVFLLTATLCQGNLQYFAKRILVRTYILMRIATRIK
jgi:hypothetical protein